MPIQQSFEIPVCFDCQGENLLGILHPGSANAATGVLVIVGGPQYRVGSHRQFVLLARHLAKTGIPTLRFDYRGMGDSTGEPRNFSDIDADIRAAVDHFFELCPDLQRVILWGLCDGASAALFYAYQDSRIKGLVLLNPWVYTEQGAAKTYLKHYYVQRLFNKDLWKKIFSLKFDYADSITSLFKLIKQFIGPKLKETAKNSTSTIKIDENLPLPMRMRECLRQFSYPVLLLLSGRDLVANEFKEMVKSDIEWQALLSSPIVSRQDFALADHTFSSEAWRNQIAEQTSNWLINL